MDKSITEMLKIDKKYNKNVKNNAKSNLKC